MIGQQKVTVEIILVDDGSNDTSPMICDDYAEKLLEANQYSYSYRLAYGTLLGFTEKQTLWQEVEQQLRAKYPSECESIAEAADDYSFAGWYYNGKALTNYSDYNYMMW